MNLVSTPLDPLVILADLSFGESGAYLPPVEHIGVRAYPYPYVAALTISNDLDSMSTEVFENWHRYVNGAKPTADGDGLGLEIGDSFWIWNQWAREFALHWHSPKMASQTDAPCFQRLIELGRAGWFDTLHSMGNWNTSPSCSSDPRLFRDRARAALDRLDSLGLKPTVYVNHSSSLTNIGGPWGYYQGGDDIESPYYCIDLLKGFGAGFYWLDGCINFDKFGDHLEYRSKYELERAIRRFTWNHWLRRKEGERTQLVEFRGTLEDHKRVLAGFFNETLIQLQGRDGTPFFAFKRYRGFEQPVMSTFCNQVTEEGLDRLEAMRGVAIIYQHFGLSGPRGRSDALSQKKRRFTSEPVFDIHAQERLRDIASRFHSGRLWVALTSRILRYLWLRKALCYRVIRGEDKWIVVLIGTKCAVAGNAMVTYADLNGLSFSVPNTAPDIVVSVAGRAAALPMRRAADPGWPGRDAVYLEWEPLQWTF